MWISEPTVSPADAIEHRPLFIESESGALVAMGNVAPGDAGIDQTAAAIFAVAQAWAWRRRAGELGFLRVPSYPNSIETVYTSARELVNFHADPAGVELIRWPGRLLSNGRGDCDDVAALVLGTLAASGCAAQDLYVCVVDTGRKDSTGRKTFHHVFAAVRGSTIFNTFRFDPKMPELFPIDPQEGYFGKWPSHIKRVRWYRAFGEHGLAQG